LTEVNFGWDNTAPSPAADTFRKSLLEIFFTKYSYKR